MSPSPYRTLDEDQPGDGMPIDADYGPAPRRTEYKFSHVTTGRYLPTPGKAPADYLSQLQGLGYTVTSVNDREKDYVEVEIVKGQNSYEVQLDLNTKTGKAEKVDVTNNLWESDATEAALKRRGG